MKPALVSQLKSNDAWIAQAEASGAKSPDMPMKTKWTIYVKMKFGGKKKKSSNSGGMGRAGRRKARPRVAQGRK